MITQWKNNESISAKGVMGFSVIWKKFFLTCSEGHLQNLYVLNDTYSHKQVLRAYATKHNMRPQKSSTEKHFLRFVHTTKVKNINTNHRNKIYFYSFYFVIYRTPSKWNLVTEFKILINEEKSLCYTTFN